MIIGTAGHIDHGKTALVRALTGVDTDRLKEEKARGISIDVGFAYLPIPDGPVLGFVDVPGHEKFIHNMLAGSSGLDFVLLVIAADDGPMPQTREHLAIIDLLGVKAGFVVLTKVDLVDAARRKEVCTEIEGLVAGTCLEGAEILRVSTVTGEGIEELRNRLIDVARAAEARAHDSRFRLVIDRSFTLAGAGTVVTGTVVSGMVSVDDRLIVSPSGIAARVRSIHAMNRSARSGVAGQRCALNLSGENVSKDAVLRGDVVVDPFLHARTDRVDASMRILASERRSLEQWTPVRLHHGAAEVGARVVLLRETPVAPGEQAFVQLVLDKPIMAVCGDPFILRDTSAQRTIGGGRFLDLRPPVRKRRADTRMTQLAVLNRPLWTDVVRGLLELPPYFVYLTGFARDRALSEEQMAAAVENLSIITITVSGALYGMGKPAVDGLRRDVGASLEEFHHVNPDLPGISVEKLRTNLAPLLPKDLFLELLRMLSRDKSIAIDGAWLRLATHEARLTLQDEQAWARIMPLIGGEQRFRPPRVRDIATELGVGEADVRRVLKLLSRMGKVDEIAHDHFFLRTTVAEMVTCIADLAGEATNGEFSAAQFRDKLDNGRKVAIQSLEFFDRHGVTLRRGDMRRLNPHRVDLFGELPPPKGRAA
jgi:selenocysteine-specific elongation factor